VKSLRRADRRRRNAAAVEAEEAVTRSCPQCGAMFMERPLSRFCADACRTAWLTDYGRQPEAPVTRQVHSPSRIGDVPPRKQQLQAISSGRMAS
jgi:hypothetical protein